MSMSVNLHANHSEEFTSRGHVTQTNGTMYSVISIKVNGGENAQEVTLFLSQEQLNQLKKTLISTSVVYRREVSRKMLENDTTV